MGSFGALPESRYRMPRKFIRRLSVPFRKNQRDTAWYLRPFHALLAHPVYFSVNRRSIVGGLALGLFIGVMPFLGHTPVVVLAALLLRVNLPVAVLSIWVANPLTYGPIFYGEYRLGTFLLNQAPTVVTLDLPWLELAAALARTWRPLWVGAIVSGIVVAGSAYVLGNAGWRLMTLWRLRRREERRLRTQT